MLPIVLAVPSLAYDEKKFCDAQATAAVVFVDVTTEFDSRSKSLFEEGILEILDSLSGGQRLLLVSIEDSFAASQKLFDGCIPFCPDYSVLDPEYYMSGCTSGLVKLRKKEQKMAVGMALQKRLSKTSNLPKSEILRTISFTMNTVSRNAKSTEIFVFSDMIENSQFFPAKLFWSRPLKELVSSISEAELLPNLRATKIRVFGVGRGGDALRTPLTQPQLARIKKVWGAFFNEAGATDLYLGEALSVN